MQVDSAIPCRYKGLCSGCEWIERPYQTQIQHKLEHVKGLLAAQGLKAPESIGMRTVAPAGLRDRADLTWHDGKLGLFGTDRSGITDLAACPQMSPALDLWYQAFRALLPIPVVRKGSVRLRVSPGGQRGVWLDLANVDVKALLDEASWLRRLSEEAVVEIGQRRKRLIQKDDRLKLGDPELLPWFETYVGSELEPRPLYLSIASFTQPGFAATRALIEEVRRALPKKPTGTWLELFCGIGTFTLPLASWGFRVEALEVDEGALAGLSRSLEESNLQEFVKVRRRDLYQTRVAEVLAGHEGLLVDPPRSGLKSVLKWLEETESSARPRRLVYVSCFAESLAADAGALSGLGYDLRRLVAVDQFPQSPHAEWVASFER